MAASQTSTGAGELRGAGLRVTAARVALLETVRHGDHLGVDAIASGVRDRVGHVPRLGHRPQFLSTVIRLDRKDAHVREP